MLLNYPAVSVLESNVLFPVHEGRLGVGRLTDRHGNPDLIVEFTTEYLTRYRAIAPKGRLPQTITEIMPTLHLLLNDAELALKAGLLRLGKPGGGHDLRTLFCGLEDEHREEAERRFVDAAPNAPLKALRGERPTVEKVLDVYGKGFDGSSVYMQTRYDAEPTTMLRSPLPKGANLESKTHCIRSFSRPSSRRIRLPERRLRACRLSAGVDELVANTGIPGPSAFSEASRAAGRPHAPERPLRSGPA